MTAVDKLCVCWFKCTTLLSLEAWLLERQHTDVIVNYWAENATQDLWNICISTDRTTKHGTEFGRWWDFALGLTHHPRSSDLFDILSLCLHPSLSSAAHLSATQLSSFVKSCCVWILLLPLVGLPLILPSVISCKSPSCLKTWWCFLCQMEF